VERHRTSRGAAGARTASNPTASTPAAPAVRRWSVLFSPDRPAVANRVVTLDDLDIAYDRGELSVHYQLVTTGDGRPAGAEALLRWDRPGHGVVDASSFVSLLSEADLIRGITDLVAADLIVALPVLRSLIDTPQTYFSFNVPARLLQDSMFPSRIAALLNTEAVAPDGLVVELTDANSVTDWRALRDGVDELRRLSILTAVDDAGAEPGDLLYRDRCDAPIVKLDRAMVAESRRWAHERRVVEATIDLCRASSVQVIAQGVEDEAAAHWLRDRGVDFMQGFHLARPVPLETLLDRLQHGDFTDEGRLRRSARSFGIGR